MYFQPFWGDLRERGRIVQELVFVGALFSEFVQPVDYLESELTEWWNGPSATTPGSMYKQIVVSVFLYSPCSLWLFSSQLVVKFGK